MNCSPTSTCAPQLFKHFAAERLLFAFARLHFTAYKFIFVRDVFITAFAPLCGEYSAALNDRRADHV